MEPPRPQRGSSTGLPIGVQLAGPPQGEAQCRLTRQIERLGETRKAGEGRHVGVRRLVPGSFPATFCSSVRHALLDPAFEQRHPLKGSHSDFGLARSAAVADREVVSFLPQECLRGRHPAKNEIWTRAFYGADGAPKARSYPVGVSVVAQSKRSNGGHECAGGRHAGTIWRRRNGHEHYR